MMPETVRCYCSDVLMMRFNYLHCLFIYFLFAGSDITISSLKQSHISSYQTPYRIVTSSWRTTVNMVVQEEKVCYSYFFNAINAAIPRFHDSVYK